MNKTKILVVSLKLHVTEQTEIVGKDRKKNI